MNLKVEYGNYFQLLPLNDAIAYTSQIFRESDSSSTLLSKAALNDGQLA